MYQKRQLLKFWCQFKSIFIMLVEYFNMQVEFGIDPSKFKIKYVYSTYQVMKIKTYLRETIFHLI